MKSESPARHLSLRQLRYFKAVVDHRSFRRAANQLCVSQPPITKQIQALERTLGIALLQRDAHSFALTAAGEAFYNETRLLLGGLDRICNTVQAFHGTRLPSFVIGLADDFVYSPHFSNLLAQAERMGTRLEPTVTLSPSLESQVAHGLLDAALVNLPLTSDPSEFVVQPVAPSRLGLVMLRQHSLAKTKRILPTALHGLPMILPPELPANAFARQCEKLLMSSGVTPAVIARTTSTAIMELLVQRGVGVGLASQYSVRPNNPRLKLVPVASGEALYRHAAIYRPDRASETLIQLLSCLEPETK
jgi:DNA-binding transcriptional LysR family regulator